MAKLTLDNVTGGYDLSVINSNFDKIETAIENTVSRDGTLPNSMGAALDMNGNSVINATSVSAQSISINGEMVVANQTFVTELPSPIGQTGKILQSDGSTAFWSTDTPADLRSDLADVAQGDALIGVKLNATGSVSRTQDAKNAELVSVKDFGAIGDGVVDDTASFTSAGSIATTVSVIVPTGIYKLNSSPTPTGSVTWEVSAGASFTGSGTLPGVTILKGGDTAAYHHTIGRSSFAKPLVQITQVESATPGASAFHHGWVFNHVRSNGNGHRQAVTGQITTTGAAAGEMNVGLSGFGFLDSGSGNIFGGNTYARVESAAASTSEAVGLEINTEIKRAVVRKVGLQIVDVATSIAAGTSYDTAVIIGNQAGGVGFQSGIQFGLGTPGTFGIKAGGALIHAASDAPAQLRAGIDFANIAAGFSQAAILLRPNSGNIKWGASGEGGQILSNTASTGMSVIFASGLMVFRNFAGTADAAKFDDNEATDKVFIYVNGSLKKVVAGAIDSGGVGFRMLRVAN